MTSSSFHNGSSKSRRVAGLIRRTGRKPALGRVLLAAGLLFASSIAGARIAPAQTPETPSSQPGQPSPTDPQQPPASPFPAPQPGRPPSTPASPPSTTIPPWTPPVPPPPSQTNVPAPFPFGTPGAAGGVPGLTTPSAFGPTVTTIRGALLEFHPTARASVEYSDNFFQTTSRTEDNFRSILGPGFNLLLNGARTFGTLSTTIDLVHDTAPDSGDDIKVHPSLDAAVRYALTPRLFATLTETFVRSDSAQDADGSGQAGIRRGRRTFFRNTLGLNVDWLLDQIATQAYYRNVLFFNEDDDRNGGDTTGNESDSITHILGANASTRIAIDYLVRAGYEFSRTDTTGGESVAGTGRDTTSHTVFGSVARQLGLYATAGLSSSFQYQTGDDSSRIYNVSLFGSYGLPTGLSVGGRVGYSIHERDDNGDTEGLVSAALDASYRFNRAVFSVGVFQDFRQTAQQGENFGTVETRSYYGSFLYQWTPFINSVLNAEYSENEPTGTGNIASGRSQTRLTYGASLNWQVLRWLTASLRYTHIKQEGNNTFGQATAGTGSFRENRASINLFAVF